MTPHELRTIGEALYGPRWQSALAHAIGMAPRQMRYLAAEERPITPFVEAHILRHAAERSAKMTDSYCKKGRCTFCGAEFRDGKWLIWRECKATPSNPNPCNWVDMWVRARPN